MKTTMVDIIVKGKMEVILVYGELKKKSTMVDLVSKKKLDLNIDNGLIIGFIIATSIIALLY